MSAKTVDGQNVSNYERFETTNLITLKRMIASLESTVGPEANPTIRFEYILASLFPKTKENMDRALNEAYMKGYIEGKNDTEEE